MSEVTPEWLEDVAYHYVSHQRQVMPDWVGECHENCPSCALKTAAQALRAEREKRERAESERERLREALRFYAKRTHWMEVSEDAGSRTVIVAIGPSGNPNGWGEAENALSTTDTSQQDKKED